MRTQLTSTLAILLSTAVIADKQAPIQEEVVVTGTRTQQSYWESPVQVSVISRADIEETHALNVAEAIDQVPGLQLKPPTGKEGQAVWIQGVSADRVLVLVNGEPVSASSGSSVDVTQIATTNVARIEIVKGATSALYGSAAIGGVVNIITEKPEAGLHGRLTMDGGSFGDKDVDNGDYPVAKQRFDGQLSYANAAFAVQAGANAVLMNGFRDVSDSWSQPGANGEQISAFVEGTWYQDANAEQKLRVDYYQQALETRYKTPNRKKHTKHDDVTRFSTRYKGEITFGESLLQWGGVYESFDNTSKPSNLTIRETETTYANLHGQFDWQLGRHDLTQGLQLNQHTMQVDSFKSAVKTVEVPHKTNSSVEYFLQDQVHWDENVQLLPGFRVQYNNQFGAKFTPKLNTRVNLVDDEEKTLFIRAGFGQGYRVPTLKEQYFEFDHSELGYILSGNPDLKPENSNSYQLEFGVMNTNGYQLSFQAFYNALTDLIDTQKTSGQGHSVGVDIYRYINVSRARTQGFEFVGSYQPISAVKTGFGYTYLDAKDLDTGLSLNNRARHVAKAQLQWFPMQDLDIGLYGQYYSEQVSYDANQTQSVTPAYTTFDMKVGYQLTPLFSVYGGVDNLTDVIRNYSDSDDQRPKSGRYGYLGIEYQF